MPQRKPPGVPSEPAPELAGLPTRLVRRYEFFTEFIDEFASAVSGAGMFVRAESPPPAGTPVEFEFKLGEEIVLLAGRGSVEWVREAGEGASQGEPGGEPPGLAVRFEKLGTGGGKVIRRLREANAQRGGEPFRLGDDEREQDEAPESGSYGAAELVGAAAAANPSAAAPEDLKRALREADAARQELGRRRAELAEARSGLEELTTRLQASERELGTARSEVAELEGELQVAREKLGEAGRRLKSLEGAEAERARDREAVAHLEAALEERGGEIERLHRRFEVKAENEKSLSEEVAKLAAARDELRGELDAKEAELAWLRGRAPEGGVPPEAAAGSGRPLEEAAGPATDLRRELEEARRTIAAIQEEALRAGREAPTVAIAAPPRRGPRALLGAAALALAGAAIGALAVWQLRPAPSPGAGVVAEVARPAAAAAAEPEPGRTPASGSAGSPAAAAPAEAGAAAESAPPPATQAEDPAPAVRPDPLAAVAAWAAAWSDQRVDDYLASYSPDFEPPGGSARPAWESQRRERLRRPSFIRVVVEGPEVEALGPERARVRFRQSYESESFSDRVDKALDLALEDGRWRIVAERAE